MIFNPPDFKKFVLVGVISLTVFGIFLNIMQHEVNLYAALTEESQGVEITTAIFYLIAGMTLLYTSIIKAIALKRYLLSTLPILLGLFFIFIAGEEESWGQWIFEFSTPEELKSLNYQEEVTIHNLNVFTGIFHAHFILNLFIVAYGIVIPVVYAFSRHIQDFMGKINCPVIPWYYTPGFAVALVYEKVARADTPDMYAMHLWRHTEVMEFFFSIVFLAFALGASGNIPVME